MIRDQQLKLVFPNGQEEVVIEAYTPDAAAASPRLNTVKQLFTGFGGGVDNLPSNVLKFQKPKK
jgi:hypothetical protein